MTNKKEFLGNFNTEWNTPSASLRNQFYWDLIISMQIPCVMSREKIDFSKSPSFCLGGKILSEGDIAMSVAMSLVGSRTYRKKGVWDIGRTLEENFVEVKEKKEDFLNAYSAQGVLIPKASFFALPPEIGRAILANIIVGSKFTSPGFAVEIARDIQEIWGSLFNEGLIRYKLSKEEFENLLMSFLCEDLKAFIPHL